MEQVKITCDGCGADLTSTGGTPAFRLVLGSESIPHVGNIVHSVLIYPAVQRDLHFCNLRCLKDWLMEQL